MPRPGSAVGAASGSRFMIWLSSEMPFLTSWLAKMLIPQLGQADMVDYVPCVRVETPGRSRTKLRPYGIVIW